MTVLDAPACTPAAAQRRHPMLVGALALTTLLHLYLAVNNAGSWLHIHADRRAGEVDFVSLAVAGALTREEPEALYDPAAQAKVQQRFDPDGDPRPFTNPPFVASAAAVLTRWGLDVGFVAMGLFNRALLVALSAVIVAAAAGCARAVKQAFVVGGLASMSVATAVAEGTVSIVAGLGIGLVLLGDQRRHDGVIAAGLVLAVVKPHLALLPLLALAWRRQWRPLLLAAGSGLLLAAPSLVWPGPSAWLRWPAALAGAGGSNSAATDHAEHWWNLASLLFRLFPAELAGAATWTIFLVGAALGVNAAGRRRLSLPALSVVSLVVSPHTNPHDAIWLPVALALLWPAMTGHRRRRRAVTALALAGPTLGLMSIVFSAQGGSAVVVVALLGLCWFMAVTPDRDHRNDPKVPAG